MEAKEINGLRWIVKLDLQPIIRVSMSGMLAIVSFVLACVTVEFASITWCFIVLTMFFVERHIAWCFGRERLEFNKRNQNHGR